MKKVTIPAFPLGPEPRIESREQAAQALENLTWLDAQADAAESVCNAKIAKAKTAATASLALQVGDSATNVVTYAQLLRLELQRWALESQEEFATEKTLKMSHGSIGLRCNPSSIDSIGDAKGHKERIEAALQPEITALLAKHGYLGVWRLVLAPDLTQLGKAIKENTKTPGDLQKLGFRVVPGESRVEVTVGVTTEKKKRK